jgi:sortase A
MKRCIILLALLVLTSCSGVVGRGDAPSSAPLDAPHKPRPMLVSVPELGIKHVHAVNAPADNRRPLRHGFLHVEGTGYPWQQHSNVYLAGHDLGFPGTDSWRLLWHLDTLMQRDRVILETAEGTRYVYSVYESEVIEPTDTRVMLPQDGKRIVTLQTCVPHFEWSQRLVVRAELVEVESERETKSFR